MLPPVPGFDEDDALEGSPGGTAVALFVQPELTRDKRDWIVVYWFLLGEVRIWQSFLLGPLSTMSMDEALAKARDLDSPFLQRAQEMFLESVPLEVKH